MRVLIRLIRHFGSDRRGNIAVVFALACLPLVTAVGCAIDYSRATQMRSKLQAAADAASVGSVAQKSPGFVAAATMTSDGPIAAGMSDASNIFDANMQGVTGYTLNYRTPTVTKTGTTVTSIVNFSASIPTVFMGVIGKSSLTMSGTSKSSASLPLYLDFYLTLDVSGSMGLPSTPAEAQRMQALNPDNYKQYPTGCTLACHFSPQKSACTDSGTQRYPTNNYCMGYAYSRVSPSALSKLINMSSTWSVPKPVPGLPNSMVSGLPGSLNTDPTWGLPAVSSCAAAGTDACIQLRLDAVGYAVNQLFITANADEKVTNQFRIGLYPFITELYSSYFPLTSSINGSPTNSSTINYAAANLAILLDTNMNANLGSGGTHIDNALQTLNGLITSVGDGSTATKTLPYVFLVTDGAQDPQSKGVPNGSWSGSNHATVLNDVNNVSYPNACADLKKRGIKISVLYIPYVPINPVNASFANDEDDYANNNIASIPDSLKGCASPPDAAGSYYYVANTPQDITDSLNAMFNHALTVAHITN